MNSTSNGQKRKAKCYLGYYKCQIPQWIVLIVEKAFVYGISYIYLLYSVL